MASSVEKCELGCFCRHDFWYVCVRKTGSGGQAVTVTGGGQEGQVEKEDRLVRWVQFRVCVCVCGSVTWRCLLLILRLPLPVLLVVAFLLQGQLVAHVKRLTNCAHDPHGVGLQGETKTEAKKRGASVCVCVCAC